MEVPNKPHQEFSTKMLWLASLAVVRGLVFQKVDTRRRAARFVFADPHNQGPAIEEEFREGDPLVPLHALHDAMSVMRYCLKEAQLERGRAR